MLTPVQKIVIKTLCANRSENSFLGGGSMLNRNCRRMSEDIDVFHSDSVDARHAFDADCEALQSAGFDIQIQAVHENPFFAKVLAFDSSGERTQLDWTTDSGHRFFPAQKHPEYGYILHDVDILVGKIFACVGRNVVRDYYDVCSAWLRGEPVVECLFAAPACDPGYSPLELLDAMSWSSQYRVEHLRELDFGKDMSEEDCKALLRSCKAAFLEMSSVARQTFERLPVDEAGTLFLRPLTLKPYFPSDEEFREGGNFLRNCGRSFCPDIECSPQMSFS